jgi:hypothetical protein
MDVRHDRVVTGGCSAVELTVHIPVERDLVPDEALTVLPRQREAASGNVITKAPNTQAYVGGGRLLRVTAGCPSVPGEPL